ncbi:hypothetical protein ACTWJ9_33365 (plasmid) [Streptomyces sp. GDS52]|uniref:hypothetical protein n=1 Tax=Streptomyces sp. GDS52 TaxID=3406419 RepID=UPI003FD0137B
MTGQGEGAIEDVFAAPTSLTAETALRQINHLLANGASPEDVRGVVVSAIARIDMMRRSRPPRQSGRKRRWLARLTSAAFPRSFAVGTPPMAKDYPDLEAHLAAAAEYAAKEHHVCFTIEITDGGAGATGREIEVQVPADDALRFGPQMVRIADFQLASNPARRKTPPTEGEQVT